MTKNEGHNIKESMTSFEKNENATMFIFRKKNISSLVDTHHDIRGSSRR